MTTSIDKDIIEKYQPQVYLNCASPNMSYLVLSDFANLPVVNIDRRAYLSMTGNSFYVKKQKELLSKNIKNLPINFVTIAANTGLNEFYDECVANLKSKNFKIEETVDSTFLGFQGQKLKVIFGQFNW